MVQQLHPQGNHGAIAVRWLLILVFIPLSVQGIPRNLTFEELRQEDWHRFPKPVALQKNSEMSADFNYLPPYLPRRCGTL